MAKLGNGCAAFLGINDPAVDVMDDFFERISHPAMTDLAIDFAGAEVDGVYPRRPADLYAGRPVIITGRYQGSLPARSRRARSPRRRAQPADPGAERSGRG